MIRKDHVDTLCRVWSDGFTIVDSLIDTATCANNFMKAPEQDEHIIRYPRLPKLLRTVSDRKRMLSSTLDTEQTESAFSVSPVPLKKLSLESIPQTVSKIVGWNGVVSLQKANENRD